MNGVNVTTTSTTVSTSTLVPTATATSTSSNSNTSAEVRIPTPHTIDQLLKLDIRPSVSNLLYFTTLINYNTEKRDTIFCKPSDIKNILKKPQNDILTLIHRFNEYDMTEEKTQILYKIQRAIASELAQYTYEYERLKNINNIDEEEEEFPVTVNNTTARSTDNDANNNNNNNNNTTVALGNSASAPQIKRKNPSKTPATSNMTMAQKVEHMKQTKLKVKQMKQEKVSHCEDITTLIKNICSTLFYYFFPLTFLFIFAQ